MDELRKRILSDPNIQAVTIDEERQTPSMLTLRSGIPKENSLLLLEQVLQVQKGIDELLETKHVTLPNGSEILEYQQYFKGVKVDRATAKVYVQDGAINFINAGLYTIPTEQTAAPLLSKNAAVQLAKQKIGATRYAEDEIRSRMDAYKDVKKIALLQQELEEVTPDPELVFIKDFTQKGIARMRLAYKTNIYAAEPVSRSWVYVDALDGKILLVDAIIKHVNGSPNASVPVTVQTRYAGTRNIYVKQISGNDPQSGMPLTSSHPSNEVYVPGSSTWVLMDDTRGNGIETYDLNGIGGLPISVPPAYTVAKSFTDADNNWTLAEHKRAAVEDGPQEAENDDIAWDAHWGAGVVYDYWKARHNRLSFDGSNAKIKSFIHSGVAYDNAFWNGSVMTYGDGSGTAAAGFKPLTSLDVCGHEIGHGICSYTSDLVYAGESGGMNEALSDIWAACIEYYAIKNIDPALAAKYKPFYIGEQISADPNAPLRRMDKPKAQGNPDTYGGENWVTTDGCTPTLANDQCGVHTNSGVLNKWFYLLTVGSGSGSGPDAAFAGEDDGVNDAVTTGSQQHTANAYTVTGVGFGAAEELTFITESMLTSTATYAEARQVSITAAIALSGDPCSQLVASVTNAWYAVGVGAKFTAPCVTTYGFAGTAVTVSETAPINGCASSKVVNLPVLLPPNSTAVIALGGSATRNTDYYISTTNLVNTSAAAAKKTLPVTVLNDGATENTETITVRLAVTNTNGNPVNLLYTITIIDDDAVPAIGAAARTLLSQDFTRADGFTELTGWTEILEIPETSNGDPMAFGKNQWGIFGNKLAITGKDGLTGITFPGGTYNNLSESQTLVRTPLIDARGLGSSSIKFDYSVQGEVDPLTLDPENFPALDYMSVAYSFDGTNFIELTNGEFKQFASALPASGTLQATLPPVLANQRFYLGFRWHNDANAGGPQSVSIDNLSVTATPRKIENQLYHNSRNVINAGEGIYFLSIQDGELVSMIRNNSNAAPGCTNMYIEKTGNSSFNLFTTGSNLIKVSDKVFRINPSTNPDFAKSITLYYSSAQLAALEAATGKSRTTFSFYKTNATAYTGATAANSTVYPTTYTSAGSAGGLYTFTGTGTLGGSWALGTTVPAASTRMYVNNRMEQEGSVTITNGYPNPVKNTYSFAVHPVTRQQLDVTVLRADGKKMLTNKYDLQAGNNNIRLEMSHLPAGVYILNISNSSGSISSKQKIIKE